MIIFVVYGPGAKGKFVTEICDLARMAENALGEIRPHPSSGRAIWMGYVIDELLAAGFKYGDTHGFHPEAEHYKFYVDTVIAALNKSDLQEPTVDVHYTRKDTIEYMLAKGAKVIRIVVNDDDAARMAHNDFFYKNFIANYENDIEDIGRFSRMILEQQVKFESPEQKDHLMATVYSKPLKEWGKEHIRILYNACAGFTGQRQEPGIIQHKNLLEINVKDILDFNTIAVIANFAGGKLNSYVLQRCSDYKKEQEKITSFDDYIDKFLNS